jgi:iron complex outermembrane receptor protein
MNEDPSGEVEALESTAGSDPTFILPTAPVESVIGFGKSLLETPRSVTVLSAELLNAAGVENVEDLYRVAPSTYTNFRFGLQGGINVRNQAGDYYFRGMKKPDPQGNYRTIFTAFDSIEVVRGPASPIFGGGRIGGYLNFNPKTARSVSGKYMEKAEGKVSLSVGSWDRRVATFDFGGPIKGLPGDRKAGFYYYGYLEDSGSFYETAFDKHFVNQIAVSAELTDSWRAEFGGVAQFSKGGLNGGINRVTEDLFSDGKYWSGGFANQLDADGNGRISERELFGSRPATATYNPIFVSFGTISTEDQIANLRKQSVDANGRPNGPLINIVNGNPIGTGASALNGLPEPWQLDYSSFRLVDADTSKTLGEDYYDADIYDFFFDVINDSNEELTLRNQLYYHFYNQIKDGRNPFSQVQKPRTFEEKFTAAHKADYLPEWWQGQVLASPNIRYTDTFRENTTNSDFDQRRDLMAGSNGNFTPNDTFYSFLEKRGLDGSAITQINDSQYIEAGVGLLTDQTFFDKVNLILGGRFDYVDGDHTAPPGVFAGKNAQAIGTTASLDNRITTTEVHTKGSDKAYSWNASVSYNLPYNIRPYFTVAQQAALIVDTSDASIARATWRGDTYGQSQITEAGVKAQLLENKLFGTFAVFEQNRISFSQGDAEASVDKTESRGIEVELRYVPIPSVSIVASAVFSKAVYLDGSDQTVRINGRYAGFSDVRDPATGQIIAPAEAFGWGGVPQVRILGGDVYSEVPGIPDKILNLFVTYTHASGVGGAFGVSHQGGFAADRTLIWQLPDATVLNASLFYNKGSWSAKFDVNNLTDEQYFVRGANNGMMVGVRQPINFEFTLGRTF